MKKNITIILLTLIPLLSFSQSRFGVFGGISNSTLSDGFLGKIPIRSSTGLHIGGLYEYPLSTKIAFRPKLTLSFQGDREETNYSSLDDSSIDYKLTYINIPLNFKFFSKPYIIAGPQIGILASTEKGKRDFGDVKTSFDYGLNLGFGYDINNFFIEFNLYQGFPTIIEIDESYYNLEVDATNSVFQLSIGYYFK